jgi:hypothetical protein
MKPEMLCRRCEWEPDPIDPTDPNAPTRHQALVVHAAAAGHPLCCICRRSLSDIQPQTCDTCLDETRGNLSAVLAMWLELRSYLGHLQSAAYDKDQGGHDGHALPGGDLLVLLGPGSQGASDNYETVKPDDDALSIPHLLASWQHLWATARGEHISPEARLVHQARGGVVYAAVAYLEHHARWAANRLPEFADYAADIEALHALLEIKTGRARAPMKAGGACIMCKGTIIWPVDRETGLELPALRCRDCRQSYTVGQYLLAMRARRDDELSGWLRLTDAASASRRSYQTVRFWAQRGEVDSLRYCPTCKHEVPFGPLTQTESTHLLQVHVWWPDVDQRNQVTEYRAPRKPEPERDLFAELLDRTRKATG